MILFSSSNCGGPDNRKKHPDTWIEFPRSKWNIVKPWISINIKLIIILILGHFWFWLISLVVFNQFISRSLRTLRSLCWLRQRKSLIQCWRSYLEAAKKTETESTWFSYGCVLKWWVSPHFTPQVRIIFSRKTPWVCWGNPPF